MLITENVRGGNIPINFFLKNLHTLLPDKIRQLDKIVVQRNFLISTNVGAIPLAIQAATFPW
jgi:hypothetical protein